ncbi:DUF2271 domain-containing protein [Cellvibrio sp. PSBB023]|uniref:DUF2271 domain-containing protein n=1 Tax=Cellvibrio sp. PSBB023 TaxID=1945512 RepID=UPI00098EFA98|nr:DUF2271 domain-containing protein [Cellvibrio sp. PSBB023]AQT59957.1 hypothetical protein B0D95_07550 [Cellvibrio sp. PSBB023]
MRASLLFSSVLLAATLLSAVSASASDLTISVEVPALDVAEYHKPYVSIWIENEKGESTNLAVWYQLEERGQKSDKGEEWLKDMRQWWRRIGRDLDMPVDGVSGATRAPGKHSVTFTDGKAPLGKLKRGNYVLLVEAAREVGGRELVKVPFSWPLASEQSAKGSKELGEVKLSLNP